MVVNRACVPFFSLASNAKYDRFDYSSDTHRKFRSAILNWIHTGELIDVVRCFDPDTHLYSWRTKYFKQKGRIYHLLATPSLLPFISEKDTSFTSMRLPTMPV